MGGERNLSADEIRARMQGIRRDLRANVKGMVANASQIFDWKNYVRSFPWISIGLAAAAGYLLVPRRTKIIAHDKESLERLLNERNLVVAPKPEERPAPGLLGALVKIAALSALKIGVSYATRRGMELLAAPHSSPNGAHRSFAGPSSQSVPPASTMVGQPD